MKKYRLLKLISAVALLGGGAFALASKKAESVKADTTVGVGESGKILLQLNTSEWQSSGSQIGLYMFNNSVSKSAWGDLVTPSGSSRYVEYSYNLDFTPAQCIAFRFDPGVEVMGDWCWENDRGNSAIWSTTGNTDFKDVVWLGNYYPDSKWTESGAYNLDAVVKGGASDSWTEATVDTRLTNVKVNADDKIEVYGSVTLPADTYFKVVKEGEWLGNWDAEPAIKSNFSGDGSSNIHNTAAGTYSFYFAYDAKTLWIADPIQAEADDWAHDFLSVNCVATKAQWSTMGARYNAMSSEAKAKFVAEAHVTHDAVVTGFIAQAVQRYDYVIQRYGTGTYADFMGRIDAGKISAGSLAYLDVNYNNNNPTNLIVIVSIVSLISASTLVGLIVIKKRKSISK